MKALITGASSGIGRDIARCLAQKGYYVILVARNESKLKELLEDLNDNGEVLIADLSNDSDVDKVISKCLTENIDVLVNNAGLGVYGNFLATDINSELNMLKVNVVALHKLTKEVYKLMKTKNGGHILNVSSSAGLMAGGPLLSSYYATKSYVRSLSLGIYEENRRDKSNVHISILCPGPVNTNFNNVAGASFNLKSLSSEYVAKYAVEKMFKNKLLIIPGFTIKLGIFFQRFICTKWLLKIAYKIQVKKGNNF